MIEITLICDQCGAQLGPVISQATSCFVTINQMILKNKWKPFMSKDLCRRCSSPLVESWATQKSNEDATTVLTKEPV